MNTRILFNDQLNPEPESSGSIAIFTMTDADLRALGFIDQYGYPSGSFVEIIRALDVISPFDYEHGCRIFDPMPGGYHLYNYFLEMDER